MRQYDIYIGGKLRELRKIINLTQEEVAERMKISSYSNLAQVELGKKKITDKMAMRYLTQGLQLAGWEANQRFREWRLASAICEYRQVSGENCDDFIKSMQIIEMIGKAEPDELCFKITKLSDTEKVLIDAMVDKLMDKKKK